MKGEGSVFKIEIYKEIVKDYSSGNYDNKLNYIYKLMQKYQMPRDEILNILLKYGDKETLKGLRISGRGGSIKIWANQAIQEYLVNNMSLEDISLKYEVDEFKLKDLLIYHGDMDVWIKIMGLNSDPDGINKQYYLENLPNIMMHDLLAIMQTSFKYHEIIKSTQKHPPNIDISA